MNQAKDAIASPTWEESWNFDATGNWSQYNRNGVMDNRTHNEANELLTGVSHDANGNMTTMPNPSGVGNLNCVYDAWNRLVSVNSTIRYEYDGLNRRIAKTVSSTRTESFFNEQWQELESCQGNVTTTYVWGLRYIDDLVLRERGAERLYAVADPNWNIVATTNTSGAVQERFVYDAFGRISGLNSDWNRTFTGQIFDQETGLMLYRNRFYHTGLGRFISRDPIGYDEHDLNTYGYVTNSPAVNTDVEGLFKMVFHCKGKIFKRDITVPLS